MSISYLYVNEARFDSFNPSYKEVCSPIIHWIRFFLVGFIMSTHCCPVPFFLFALFVNIFTWSIFNSFGMVVKQPVANISSHYEIFSSVCFDRFFFAASPTDSNRFLKRLFFITFFSLRFLYSLHVRNLNFKQRARESDKKQLTHDDKHGLNEYMKL